MTSKFGPLLLGVAVVVIFAVVWLMGVAQVLQRGH